MKNKKYSMPNHLANSLDNSSQNAQYDKHAKEILANKQVLSRILSATVAEYKDVPLDVISSLIGDDLEIGKHYLEPLAKVRELNTESTIPGEGRVTYDIKFSAKLPNKDDTISLIINVEAQRKFNTPYDIVTRAVFYTCRMISEQLETEFSIGKNHSYDDIKKVYSIWICMNTPEDIANSITEFKMTKNSIYGTFNREVRYDLQSVILVCLDKNPLQTDNDFLGALETIFTEDFDSATKKKRLKENFNFELDNEIDGRLMDMCNLSQNIAERNLNKGIGIGREEGREEGIDIGENKMLFKLVYLNAINKDIAYTQTNLSKEEFDKAYSEWLKENKQD